MNQFEDGTQESTMDEVKLFSFFNPRYMNTYTYIMSYSQLYLGSNAVGNEFNILIAFLHILQGY